MTNTQKKLLFLTLFTAFGFVFLQLPFTKLAGSQISFTLFDFFAPIAAIFLGPVFGVISILTVEVVNMLVKQQAFNTVSVIRLFPLLFAALYFANPNKKNWMLLVIPLICIISFNLNPVGREVWYYSLLWTVPMAAYFYRKNLLVRSLGATFLAHAVGGAGWIWAFNLPASFWSNLIPTVIMERSLFALGIAGSFLVTRYVLKFLSDKKVLPSLDLH